MFKSKSFLLSSAALMMFLTLSAPAAHAMEDESSELSSAQTIAKKYPVTASGYLDLKKDARKGNLVARDEVMKRYERGCIALVWEDISHFFETPNLEERILSKPGYALVLFDCFEEEAADHFPDIISKLKQKADVEGNPVAQYNLGFIHFNGYGEGDRKDEATILRWREQAIRYYTLAANQGYAEAFVGLSEYHPGDPSLFRKGAAKGSSRAAWKLHFRHNYDSKQLAEHFLETLRIAEQGNSEALEELLKLSIRMEKEGAPFSIPSFIKMKVIKLMEVRESFTL